MTSPPVHLWYVDPRLLTDARSIDRCRARLAPDELARIARVRFERHRHQRIIGWSLVRTALSSQAPVAPEAWRFERDPKGRPEIAEPLVTPRLRFNLSHTEGLVACVVAESDDVGLDVEDARRRADIPKIARRFFARSEVETIERAIEGDRARVFFEHWTLKEAYLKARGTGMSLPLAQIVFSFAGTRSPSASFGPAIEDSSADWQFACLQPTPNYVAAIALRRPASAPGSIVLRQAIPGVNF